MADRFRGNDRKAKIMESILQSLFVFLTWLVRASWQVSVLIILVMAIQIIFRKQLSARWRYALWLVVVVRMLAPVLPASRISIYNLSRLAPKPAAMALTSGPAKISAPAEIDHQKKAALSVSIGGANSPGEPLFPLRSFGQWATLLQTWQTARPEASPYLSIFPSLKTALAFLWLAGALVLFLRVLWDNHRFSIRIIRKRPVTDPDLLDLLEDCKAEMKVHTPIQLIITPQVASPVLLGFIRPRLLLPENVTASFSLRELHYIFLHEIAHVKRLDIPVNWLMTVLQVLHWFNPFVWLAFGRMRIDREQACDALVLACRSLSYQPNQQGSVNDEKTRYGEIIIKLLTNITQTTSLPSFAGILEGKSQMKTRIEMIAQFSRKSYQWSVLAVILMAGLALVGFTRANDPADQQNQNKANASNPNGQYAKVKAKFTMFQAKYQGGKWNVNPSAVINLATQLNKWAHNNVSPALPTEIDISSDQIFDVKPPFLYISGDGDFQFSDKEVKNLKTYLQLGGAIWADNASAAFDTAFRREIKRVLPDSEFEAVRPDDKLFNAYFTNVHAPQEPAEIIKAGEIAAVLYTHGLGNLWTYRLTDQDTVDRNAILAPMDKNIQDDTVLNAYKYGVNCLVYLLTRYQEHFKFLPKASASPVKPEPAAVPSAGNKTALNGKEGNSDQKSAPEIPPLEIVLTINEAGQVFCNDQAIDTPAARDLPNLRDKIKRCFYLFGDQQLIIVDPQPKTRQQRIEDVLNACAATGVKNLSFKLSKQANGKDVKIIPFTQDGKNTSGSFIVTLGWNENLYEATYTANGVKMSSAVEMTALIMQHKKQQENPQKFRVIIMADKKVPYEFTQQAMAAVAEADVANVLFSTTENKSN